MRLVLLDEGIFEDERLGLGVGEHQVDCADVCHERIRLRVVILLLEVARHPFFKILGLPDVEDRAGFVTEEVAAGAVGKGSEIDHLVFLVM